MNRCILSILLCLLSPVLFAQEIKTVKPELKKISRAPKYFYIASVTDDRTDTTNIGSLRIGTGADITLFNPENGIAGAIKVLLPDSRSQNATPIEMHITHFRVSETIRRNAFEEVQDTAGFAFYRNGIKLVEFAGSIGFRTNMGAYNNIGQLLSEPVEIALSKLETWWSEHKEQLSAPPGIHVSAKIALLHDKDLVDYDPARPLLLTDFRGTPEDTSPGDAATSSGIHINYNTRIEYGNTEVLVTVMPAFDKQQSWVKKGGKNQQTLRHEQLHFDITAIKACRFIQLLKAGTFSVDNYTQELDAIYKQVQQEWEKMEDDYDRETRHGQLVNEQNRWQSEIKSQLETLDCYR